MIFDDDGRPLFTIEELACRHCGELKLADGFATALKILRTAYGKPMKVMSCCRCPEHNTSIGGHPRSMHLMREGRTQGSCAIDVAVTSPATLVRFALGLGWSVGVATTFIHLDRRSDYTDFKQTVFGYGGG